MIAVWKREFRSLCRSVRGMIFLGGYLLLAGVFTTLFNFNAGSGTFEVALSYMVPAQVLLIPLLCISMFGKEDASDPDRLLLLLPLRTRDVIFGKYLARFSMLLLANAVLALYPLLISFYGTINIATCLLTLLALLLLGGILLALGTFFTVLLRDLRISIPVLYGTFILWYAAGIFLSLLPIPELDGLWNILSPFRSLDEFVFGLPDIRLLLIYGLWTALFLGLAIIAYAKKQGRPSHRPRSHVYRHMSCLALSISFLVVMVGSVHGITRLPARVMRMDVTAEKSYTLSDQTKNLLRNLSCDVTIWVLDPSGDDVRLERFLDRMTDYSPRLTIKSVDTAKDTNFLVDKGLSGAEFSPYSLLIESEAREKFIDYTGLFSFSNASLGLSQITAAELASYESIFAQQYPEYYAYLQYDTVQHFEGDTLIPFLMEYVTAEKIPTAYLVAGLGTNPADSIIAYCMAYYGMEFNTWNPNEHADIPDDAASLVLFSPDRDLTDVETETIRAYLRRGGQLTVLTAEEELDKVNLMSLLADYALSAEKGALTEPVKMEGESNPPSQQSDENVIGPRPTPVEETTTLTLIPNENHDIMANAAESTDFSVVVSNANAIRYPENPSGSLYIQPILTTSKGECVAVSAETADGARVVWFTAADSYIAAEDVSQSVKNASCVAVAAAWTSWQYRSSLTQVPSTPYTSVTLNVTATDATLMGALLILIVPAAAVSLCALLRLKKKKSFG